MSTIDGLLLGDAEYASIAVLILAAAVVTLGILLASHLIGPKRRGPVKDSVYESGMEPISDARRKFNVRFYIVAMLFLLFDVEIVFFYPWAALFPRLNAEAGSPHQAWAEEMVAGGFGVGFFLVEMLIFIAILLVGYIYALRKGVFRWD
ncbi:MAG: NADH-quinone oxidoreductase subunit A [Planctomycetes bacterium]|nr:NADH-quinone oxidoreductase subunit A [Planctomycetota bacterium]